MTIFRVNTDRDRPSILGDKRYVDLQKAAYDWDLSCKQLAKSMETIEKDGSFAMKQSRRVYKTCDDALKNKTISGSDKKELTALRKKSYDLTTKLKKLGIK